MNRQVFARVMAMLLLLGGAGQVNAQAFGSVSSLHQAGAPPPATSASGWSTTVEPASPGAAADAVAAPTTESATAVAPAATGTPPVAAPVEAAPPPFSSGASAATSPPAGAAATEASPAMAGASVSVPAYAPRPFSSLSSGAEAYAPSGGSGPVLPGAVGAGSSSYQMAERIVVEKAQRRLLLMNGGEVIASYPVKLGLNPYGHKQREGDFRTPEGTYYLSRRNPNSDYFLSVEVSYPNSEDRERARRAGVRPGGLIMIHGQPNVPRKSREYYANYDWTDGCIAVSNADMAEIWRRTRLGVPIEIRP